MNLRLSALSFCLGISLLFFLVNCRKNNDAPALTGNWTTADSKTFDDPVMWTASGKVTDQAKIREYVGRNDSEFFTIDKTPEPLESSANFHFKSDLAVIDIDGEIDTAQYLVKNNSLVLLKHDVRAFAVPPANQCERLIDSLQVYPITTKCDPLPPVSAGFPPGSFCLVPQYYPIEIHGDEFRLAVFNFHIRSVNKEQQILYCSAARENTANVISEGLNKMLQAGDTIVTQKAYVRLNKL